MEMFKFSEFDLERTTTKSTIIVYISLDFLLLQTLSFAAIEQIVSFAGVIRVVEEALRDDSNNSCEGDYRVNTTMDSFVFIAGSFLLQLTKLVIRLSKSIMGAAIKM